ncbi:hypothetical protein DID88_009556 [Monilinia fructigena]|uniref:Uncharacterized protein n=1 Tax=Monilinia fructigena TaxID=38457 RepID=A0A395IMJ2_9HELO|nr:hypothetical protein DID88_009556 [Monilinia fructigena]
MRISTSSLLALPSSPRPKNPPSNKPKLKHNTGSANFNPTSHLLPPKTPRSRHPKVVGQAKIHHLTLDTWQETIRGSVTPESTLPQEWWVLATGGNKTCYGLCGKVERGFNESAAVFSLDPTAPHMALLNCDEQPVLCNSWGAGPPHLWTMEVGAPGSPVPIITIPLNTTSTTLDIYDWYFHFLSRTIMGKRTLGPQRPAPAPAPRPRGAPPGDGVAY